MPEKQPAKIPSKNSDMEIAIPSIGSAASLAYFTAFRQINAFLDGIARSILKSSRNPRSESQTRTINPIHPLILHIRQILQIQSERHILTQRHPAIEI